jgi:HNH endonuclease
LGYQSNYAARRFSSGAVALAAARQTGRDNILRCANPKCGAPLTSETQREDHIIPWWIKGHSGPSNCQLLCAPCHDAKTASIDVPVIAKLKRLRRRKAARHPMPCGRSSRWSKPIGAFGPVRRTSVAEKIAATLARRRFEEAPS